MASQDAQILREIALLSGTYQKGPTLVATESIICLTGAIDRHTSAPSSRGRGSAVRRRHATWPARGNSHNRSLVINKPRLDARMASRDVPKPVPVASTSKSEQTTRLATPVPIIAVKTPSKSILNGSGAARQIVIDGVTFISDATGKKLIRKKGECLDTCRNLCHP